MTDTAKEVVEVRRHLDELRYHFLPVRHDEKAAHVVERTIALIAALQSSFEKARADVVRLEWEVADKQARIEALEAALRDIAEYSGEGPLTTPWRDIVREVSKTANAALPPAPQEAP